MNRDTSLTVKIAESLEWLAGGAAPSYIPHGSVRALARAGFVNDFNRDGPEGALRRPGTRRLMRGHT